MKKIKLVTICKPIETATFEIGDKIFRGGKETDVIVSKIKAGFFKKITIILSDGSLIVSKGNPIIIEK